LPKPWIRQIGGPSGIVVLLVIWFYPFPFLSLPAKQALAITLFAVIWWVTEPVEIEYTGLIVLFLLIITHTVDFGIAFSGMSSRATWLVLSGSILGLGITQTHLGEVMATLLIQRSGFKFKRLILSLVLLGFLIACFIPSATVRVLILMPLAIKLAETLGVKPHSHEAAAIVSALIFSTYYGGHSILTAGLPNVVVLGIVENMLNQTISWGEWAYVMFPVLGIGRIFLIYLLILKFFPVSQADISFQNSVLETPLKPKQPNSEFLKIKKLSTQEKKVMALLGLAVLLWILDFWHHLHPTYIALLVALLYFLPKWGVFEFKTIHQINYPIIFYLGAMFGLSATLQATHLNDQVVRFIEGYLNFRNYGWFFFHYYFFLLTSIFSFLTDTAAEAAVITPLLIQIVQTTDHPVLPTVFSMSVAYSNPFFPYQATPLILAYSFRWMSLAQTLKMTLTLAILTLLVLTPLTILYWKGIGVIP
jgi:anion transporter